MRAEKLFDVVAIGMIIFVGSFIYLTLQLPSEYRSLNSKYLRIQIDYDNSVQKQFQKVNRRSMAIIKAIDNRDLMLNHWEAPDDLEYL